MTNVWEKIHFILNEDGQVIGDFEKGTAPYRFLRDGKSFAFDEALPEERVLLMQLVYLFFTVGETSYVDGYEYVALEGYTLYRPVAQVLLYADLMYDCDPVASSSYLYLTVPVSVESYYLLTAKDTGFAEAVARHFEDDYGLTVDTECIVAKTEAEMAYWNQNVTAV